MLIVDDEDSLRTTIGRWFAHRGHRVIGAGSGEEGLEVARRQCPDVIIAD
jgi:CheY-like chemotaxis protein